MDDESRAMLRKIPKMDEILAVLEKRKAFESASRSVVLKVCRSMTESIRTEILKGKMAAEDPGDSLSPEGLADAVMVRLAELMRNRLRPVVNATGILLHTNLGRAPLPEEAVENIMAVSRGYSNLEYNLQNGKRGLRYDHVTDIICELTGAQDALVVNNNAAAVLLVLNTLSNGRESIVSRGELIEIGGEFRIPEIMKKSGAILREVGTTNRTRLADYELAVNDSTALIMKVHPSNYRIIGFTEETGLPELVALGNRMNVPVFNDLGSGCLIDLEKYGLAREPTVQEVVAAGTDVVTFSGDKLLGGPQAGIIVGNSRLLGEIKSNPLNRALRIDKLTLAALESTLRLYLNPESALEKLRGLRSLTEPAGRVEKRAKKLLSLLRRSAPQGLTLKIRPGKSLSGGGALPAQTIPTMVLAVKDSGISAESLERALRGAEPPVIARIVEEEVLLDVRTIDESDFPAIVKAFSGLNRL